MTHRQSNGVEISGFIDYEESLRKTILEFDEGATDWYEIFKETKRIKPKKNDLGFVLSKMQCSKRITFHTLHLDITIGTLVSQF